MKWLMRLLIVAILVGAVIWGIGLIPEKKATMEKFNKIQTGMTYKQVTEIIGDPGEKMISGSTPSILGIIDPIESKVYMWKNYDGTNITIHFQNDKVMNKGQMGL